MYKIGFDAKRLFLNGTGLGNWRGWPVTFRSGDNTNSDYYGTFAWFYHPTLDTTTPALSFDGVSTGGGGGDEPIPTTLAGKIAMHATTAPSHGFSTLLSTRTPHPSPLTLRVQVEAVEAMSLSPPRWPGK